MVDCKKKYLISHRPVFYATTVRKNIFSILHSIFISKAQLFRGPSIFQGTSIPKKISYLHFKCPNIFQGTSISKKSKFTEWSRFSIPNRPKFSHPNLYLKFTLSILFRGSIWYPCKKKRSDNIGQYTYSCIPRRPFFYATTMWEWECFMLIFFTLLYHRGTIPRPCYFMHILEESINTPIKIIPNRSFF